MAWVFDDFRILVRVETDLWNEVERRLRLVEGAVSLGRHHILELAAGEGPTRVQDIADALRITVGAASRLTDRLEADALIVRMPHPTDRRGSQILPTDKGRRALEITTPAINAALAVILGDDGAAALAQAADLLRSIARTSIGTPDDKENR